MTVDSDFARYLSLREAANCLPGRPHLSTLHRWRTRGVRGVRLITERVGGRRMVAADELQRFIEAVTAAADGEPTPIRSAKQRERSIESAEHELLRAGIGRRGKSTQPQA
jgi:hypothetical protein